MTLPLEAVQRPYAAGNADNIIQAIQCNDAKLARAVEVGRLGRYLVDLEQRRICTVYLENLSQECTPTWVTAVYAAKRSPWAARYIARRRIAGIGRWLRDPPIALADVHGAP